jgi:LmbE family N-acetylglucosaminyl deacetylase
VIPSKAIKYHSGLYNWIMSEYMFLFISPHLDDVVLSCGGYISRLAAAGEHVIIVTVATADVPKGTSLSRQMIWRHLIWRQGNKPFAARCREDATAAAILGVQYRHLDLLDAIYRCDASNKPLYPNSNVHVPIHAFDWENYEPILRRELLQVLSAWDSWQVRVFCPLGVGEHIDHILVRSAVEEAYEPQKIIYYEDYPYVNNLDALQYLSYLSNSGESWQTITVKLTPIEIEARIASVACYVSQIPVLFPSKLQHLQNRASFHLLIIGRYLNWPMNMKGSRERIDLPLRSYISRVGGERYWVRNAEQVPDLNMDKERTKP